jgi:ParB family chromosome partitioning protein
MTTARDKLATKKTKLASIQTHLEDHPANLNNYQDGSFYHVDISLILPSPDQPRKFFDKESLNELAVSIRQKGVLQPVIIRKDDKGNIFLVAGERRLKAAKIAGLDKIPAIITKGNPAEIALIENLQREDLKPIEEAEALNRMIVEYGYTQDKLAQVLGKAKSTVSEIMSLSRLPNAIKNEVRRAELFPRRLLVEIAKQNTEEKMTALFARIKENNLKSSAVREITRPKNTEPKKTSTELAVSKASALNKHLGMLDIKNIDKAEKVQLFNELKGLKKTIDELLH